jgi:hypothetical protein
VGSSVSQTVRETETEDNQRELCLEMLRGLTLGPGCPGVRI